MTQTHIAAGFAVSIVLIGGVYYLFTKEGEPEPEPQASPRRTEEPFTPVVNVSKKVSKIE